VLKRWWRSKANLGEFQNKSTFSRVQNIAKTLRKDVALAAKVR